MTRRAVLTAAALVLGAPVAAASPLRIDASRPLPTGCLGWSERAHVALCVSGESSQEGGATWSLSFVGPGAQRFQPIPITERTARVGDSAPRLTWRDAARVRALIREWHFEPLPEPRSVLQSGDQVSWARPQIMLRWQTRVTAKGRDSDGDSWETKEDTITLRCKKGPPLTVARWKSDDDQSGSSLGVYLFEVRDAGGRWQKSYALFVRERDWAVEGDRGEEASASFLELPQGCAWYGF